jgi:predicted DNA-binding mobile mystery protein A
MTDTLNELRLRQLDAELRKYAALRTSAPNTGWIKEIRRAIGMTAAQLAKRLHVTQAAVTGWEGREQKGTISLNTLRKAADALDCDLAYVFIPRGGLESTVNRRITDVARQRVGDVGHTMGLEQQPVSDAYAKRRISALVDRMKAHPPRNLWE